MKTKQPTGDATVVMFGCPLTQRCPVCKGVGTIESEEWKRFWRVHPNDWKDFIVRNDCPDEPEESPCNACHGRGHVLNPEGHRLIQFIHDHLSDTVAVEAAKKRLSEIAEK